MKSDGFGDGIKGCCFTGHRQIADSEYERVAGEIARYTAVLAERGITHYYAGGAVGFDLAAAVTIVNRKLLMPEITLTIALPCRNHMAKWSRLDRELFTRVMRRADEVVYVSDDYSMGCMQLRNRYMVDRSSVCICYLNSGRGGTFNTVSYAEKKGIEIINIASGGQIVF